MWRNTNLENNSKRIIAITGPSGAGKTTLAEKLSNNLNIVIPRHCTTRDKRKDDKPGFYRYLSHPVYAKLLNDNLFFISSGDGKIVSKENGNFYGILKSDCLEAWENSNDIILFVSYKDIYDLIKLKESGISIDIINLTFLDLELGISSRLINNNERDHTSKDIKSRINCAFNDKMMFGDKVFEYASCNIYTDIVGIEGTYDEVCNKLFEKNKQLIKGK